MLHCTHEDDWLGSKAYLARVFGSEVDFHLPDTESHAADVSREWLSPGKTRKITLRIMTEPERPGAFVQSVSLSLLNSDFGNVELMRVQLIQDHLKAQPKYNVYLTAMSHDQSGRSLLALVGYTAENGGFLTPERAWRYPTPRQDYQYMSSKAFQVWWTSTFSSAGVYHEEQLPPQIDVKATRKLLLEQLNRKDYYSQPRLVLAAPITKNGQITHSR